MNEFQYAAQSPTACQAEGGVAVCCAEVGICPRCQQRSGGFRVCLPVVMAPEPVAAQMVKGGAPLRVCRVNIGAMAQQNRYDRMGACPCCS